MVQRQDVMHGLVQGQDHSTTIIHVRAIDLRGVRLSKFSGHLGTVLYGADQRISSHTRAIDKSVVPKEAQDEELSASMSYGRHTPP
jgi:hypothetical protein